MPTPESTSTESKLEVLEARLDELAAATGADKYTSIDSRLGALEGVWDELTNGKWSIKKDGLAILKGLAILGAVAMSAAAMFTG